MLKLNHRLIFLLKACISAILLLVLVTQVDINSAIYKLTSVSLQATLLAFTFILVSYIFATFRWSIIIDTLSKKINFWNTFKIVLIGAFFNQSLPSTIGGDVVRIWKIRQLGHPIGVSSISVALDRIVTLLALLIIIILSLPYLLSVLDNKVIRWLLILTPIIGTVSLILLLYIDRLPRIFSLWLPTKLISRISRDSRDIFLSISMAAKILPLSITIHLFSGIIVFILAKSLVINVDLIPCLLLTPLVILISTLPISLAGWGIREGIMIVIFKSVGVMPDESLALSLLFGFIILLSGIPGGIIWLLDRKKYRSNQKEQIITT